MFKDILKSVNGYDNWSIISMLIFLLFFVGLIIYVWKLDKNFSNYMSSLPLENEENSK